VSADPFPDLELTPPADAAGFALNDWFPVPSDSPTALFLYHQLWELPQRPALWEAARMSRAIYLYREKATGWTVLVKFYREKVDEWWAAEQNAANEFNRIHHVQALGLSDGAVRAVRALALRRDVLFLEHVDGLTLEDAIAVRRTRPGALPRILEDAAHLLAALHAGGRQPGAEPDLGFERFEAHKFIGDLAYAGVLQDNALVCDALRRLVDRWFSEPLMLAYTPTWIHGDATTSNFIIPTSGGMVAIDWERMRIADPASELGRLLAEVAHAVGRYGGNGDEAADVVAFTGAAYLAALPPEWEGAAVLRRARVYQASSTLRISRNGWLTRQERTGMVAQAMALLV